MNQQTTPSPPAGEPLPDAAEMWRAVETRDRAYDGRFVFAVETTGVFCRPSCGARRPLRANVTFHATPAAAERAGFRACRRCKPGEAQGGDGIDLRIVACCRMIESGEPAPPLADLAAAAGLSPSHFQRAFKARLGVSPKDYAVAVRNERVRARLVESRTVTAAIHDAGFNAAARFYAEARAILGMSTSAYRAGGRGEIIRYALAPSSLGGVLVAATGTGVCALLLGDDPAALIADLERRFRHADIRAADDDLGGLLGAAIAVVDGRAAPATLPLDIRGTAFQHRVWQALREVPAGRTVGYAELARGIGEPAATRAVAQACGANPVAVAVPCHRALSSDGGLAGYRWGTERKRTLLAREAAAPAAERETPRKRR